MSENGIYTLAKENKICRINSNLTMQIKFGSKTKNWILQVVESHTSRCRGCITHRAIHTQDSGFQNIKRKTGAE
jgi:hypothetical protein